MFAIKKPIIELAHAFWRTLVQPGDLVIDATCGNGKDSLVLAQLVGESGVLIGLDIQEEALERTRARLMAHLPPAQLKNIHLFLQSHETFPPLERAPKLVVYNLGYLPGGNKKITTLLETTLASIKNALQLLSPGGALSIVCYPGHPEGAREAKGLLDEIKNFSCYRSSERPDAPFLVVIRKN